MQPNTKLTYSDALCTDTLHEVRSRTVPGGNTNWMIYSHNGVHFSFVCFISLNVG